MNKNFGFTLVELMVVIVMITILAAIALPGYQRYLERNDLAIAKQGALRIASELERFKAKNFSYKGFDAGFVYPTYDNSTGELYLPAGSTAANAKYKLTLVDMDVEKPLTISRNGGSNETADSQLIKGLGWMIKVERKLDSNGAPKQPNNYDLLLKSNGVRCMTKTVNIVKDYVSCGTSIDTENW